MKDTTQKIAERDLRALKENTEAINNARKIYEEDTPTPNDKQSMESRFDELFAGQLALANDFFQVSYEKLHLIPSVKQFIKSEITLALAKHDAELQQRIGMFRQWLNEDRITEPSKMVTNEEIKKWLSPDVTTSNYQALKVKE